MELKQHYNYVAFYADGFKIGRTTSPHRRMRQLHAMAFDTGRPVSRAVALHTETHIRRSLRKFAIAGTLEYFEGSLEQGLMVVELTTQVQDAMEDAGL